MKENITLEDAQNMILEIIEPTGIEYIGIHDSLNRVTAMNIMAKENVPPFNRSPLDGYAFKAKDTENADANNPVVLEVIEEIPAGYEAKKRVDSGTAIKVMTGAPIPDGADAVIKYEDIDREGKNIKIYQKFQAQKNISIAGEDILVGDTIADKGMVITPPLIGLFASQGICSIPVFKMPSVAIISTGDELLDISESLRPGKIHSSNCHCIAEYCKEIAVQPKHLGIARDRKEEVAELIEQGLKEADLIVTTGGASVGDYDVIIDALKHIEAEILFWKINIKPGSPSLAAVKDGKIILGLSGNPASALVVFQLLGIPLIKKMRGQSDYTHEVIKAKLMDDFKKKSPKRRFLRGKLVFDSGNTNVLLTGAQGNGILSSMIGCNVLVDIPAGSEALSAGEDVIVKIVSGI